MPFQRRCDGPAEGRLQGRVGESERWRRTDGGNALGGEEHFLAHAAEKRCHGEGGHGENHGSMEDVAKRAHEGVLAVGAGDDVDGAAEGGITEHGGEHFGGIVEGNPGKELAAGTDGPAEAELRGGEEPGECAAMSGEHDAEAGVDDADAGVLGGAGGGFPGTADVGEKGAALRGGGGFLVEQIVAAIAVNADGGCGDERVGALVWRKVCEERCEFFGGGDAGAPDFIAVAAGPADGDVAAGEVDQGADGRRRADFAGGDVPGTAAVVALQRQDRVAAGPEACGERAADEAGGAGDGDAAEFLRAGHGYSPLT